MKKLLFGTVLILAVLGGGYYLLPYEELSSSSENLKVSSKIPGLPDFSFSAPIEFGEPVISVTVNNPEKIDGENNSQQLIFYKPDSPQTYPKAGSEIFLNINIFVSVLSPGETLDSFVDEQLLQTATEKIQYEFTTADGYRGIAQTVSPRSPIVNYYVQMGPSKVVDFMMGSPTKADVELTAKARLVTDKLLQSVRF